MAENDDASVAFYDLDAALAERNREPVVIKFKGKDYTLPEALTAAAMLAAFRLEADAPADKKAEQNMRLVLTDDVFDELVAADISWADLVDLVARLTKYYLLGAKEDVAESEDAEAPSR